MIFLNTFMRGKRLKASELIDRVVTLIEDFGDLDIAVAGVFNGGLHKDVNIFPGENYYSGGELFFKDVDCSGYFVIDEDD